MAVFAKVYTRKPYVRKPYVRKHIDGRFPVSFDEEA